MNSGIAMVIADVAGYEIRVRTNHIKVYKDSGLVADEDIPNYGTDILDLACEKYAAFGWAKIEDMEIIYIYNKADGNFGYALNLSWRHGSEWGYACFEIDPTVPQKGE